MYRACILKDTSAMTACHATHVCCGIDDQNGFHRSYVIQALTIDEALSALYELITPIQGLGTLAENSAQIALAEALNRVTTEAVLSPVDVPGFANSAMDGYAIRHEDLTHNPHARFRLQGTSAAGHPFDAPIEAGYAVRIFTGAAVPAGADTVVMQENVRADQGEIEIHSSPNKGDFVRPIGHDSPMGQPIIPSNQAINAFNLAAATTSGLEHISVYRKLSIGVFATGDELREPGSTLQSGQIFESNRIAIRSLLHGLPVTLTDLGILPDNKEATRTALDTAGRKFDALITSGGVSVGEADFVRDAIQTNGTLDFWRLNLRPGKPFAFGRLHRALIFGLPGNPVSSIVTLLLLVKPALWYLAGRTIPATAVGGESAYLDVPLAVDVKHQAGRHEFQRASLIRRGGKTYVQTTSDQSSNRLQSFTNADCLILLAGDTEHFPAGTAVPVLPFFGLI